MSKKELKIKQDLTLDQTITYLEKLVVSLKEKKIVLTKDDQHIVLEPSSNLKFKLSAEEIKNEQELTLELTWELPKVVEEGKQINFSISSTEPVVQDEVKAEPVVTITSAGTTEKKETAKEEKKKAF